MTRSRRDKKRVNQGKLPMHGTIAVQPQPEPWIVRFMTWFRRPRRDW